MTPIPLANLDIRKLQSVAIDRSILVAANNPEAVESVFTKLERYRSKSIAPRPQFRVWRFDSKILVVRRVR